MKSYLINLSLSFLILLSGMVLSNWGTDPKVVETEKPKAPVSYDDFKNLVEEVESHRSKRLISLDQFLTFSEKDNTIILDTRAGSKFFEKHIKGAKHLAFTEFTMGMLAHVIPNKDTNILIYCNNNFKGDEAHFASKIYDPKTAGDMSILMHQKPITLALNIPTYINLYGYGYRNVYELNELVDIDDERISFEGSHAKAEKLKLKSLMGF